MSVTLSVTDTFVLPQWFATATREEISDALSVIPLIFHHVASLRSHEEFTALKVALYVSSTRDEEAHGGHLDVGPQ
eukprot:CAMPEP_0118893276 /NCGR_PEP_ID=MMETSP1166-20130328/2551_1 /TAXON_ID=1104430 /ORGANISM="Chrysoreinhardia sp, Strain CCMP3193" /LENGTH=75 /DNA_ID=CAMNT_0006832075 /DNA_START=105 /DNA_END=329 /DNA_ORIENTATION=-